MTTASQAKSQALIVADSCWHSTRNLLATWPPASAPTAKLLRLEPIDWQNARNRGIRPWHWGVHSKDVSASETLVTAELPPGWMKKFPRTGQWPLAHAAQKWLKKNQLAPDQASLVITYPYYLELARQIRPRKLLYYNLDDYTLYWPARATEVTTWEARAVAQADWTVCVAVERADRLKNAYPEHARKIIHLPHAAPEWTIPEKAWLAPASAPPELAGIPRPILGYLGGLEDRVDYDLLLALADRFPNTSIVLVGPKPGVEGDTAWQKRARELLAKPNIYAAGSVEQCRIGEIYATFDVNLIPYDVAHPFNIACSPTKLLDAMGCGRPTVTTALPECQIYRGLYDVADDHRQFVAAVEKLLSNNCRDGREEARREHAWRRRSEVVLDTLFRLCQCEDPKEAYQLLESLGPIG